MEKIWNAVEPVIGNWCTAITKHTQTILICTLVCALLIPAYYQVGEAVEMSNASEITIGSAYVQLVKADLFIYGLVAFSLLAFLLIANETSQWMAGKYNTIAGDVIKVRLSKSEQVDELLGDAATKF